MRVTHVPTLATMREVYRLPPTGPRFRAYIEAAGREEVVLPLSAYNPMAKAAVVERVDELLALDAEHLAATAGRQAAARLNMIDADVMTGLALSDDLAGGWTNRWQITGPRLGDRLDRRRDGSGHLAGQRGYWVTGLLWASETPSADAVQRSIQAGLYRWAHDRCFGAPRTLGQFMRREGRARRFAGEPLPHLDPDELDYTRTVLAPLRDSADGPSALAAWWGDEIARSVGNPALGLGPGAGLALASLEAAQEPLEPQDQLLEERHGQAWS